MITIILKSGFTIEVDTDSSIETIQKAILTTTGFMTIGKSIIRAEDISAVLVTA